MQGGGGGEEGRTGGGGGGKPVMIFLKRSLWDFNFFPKQEMDIEFAQNNLRILLLHLIRKFFQKCFH